ncbi:MAG: hypothetical protein HYY26_05525 [Acidobacteria bacterium]|nr:hypothetical protein [Acidobacteriota bacterium]
MLRCENCGSEFLPDPEKKVPRPLCPACHSALQQGAPADEEIEELVSAGALPGLCGPGKDGINFYR